MGTRPEQMSVVLNNVSDKDDFIQIINVPPTLLKTMVLLTKFRCKRRSVVGLELQIVMEDNLRKTLFKSMRICEEGSKLKINQENLILADSIVYQPNYFNKRSIPIKTARLRAWMKEEGEWYLVPQKSLLYDLSEVKVSYPIHVEPPYSRPAKPITDCVRWPYQLWNQISVKKIHQCPREEEIVKILDYPIALNGLNYGVFHTFDPYNDLNLEKSRLSEINDPRITVSMWLYLLDFCTGSAINLCSIMHHFDWKGNYLSPLLFISPEGHLHIQMTLKNGETLANLTPFKLPLHQWFRLVFSIDSNKWYVTINHGENWTNILEASNEFTENILYNDAKGIFTFGGSEDVLSFKGYTGQLTFYRRKVISPRKLSMPSQQNAMFQLRLSYRDKSCENYLTWIKEKINVYKQRKLKLIYKRSCHPYFTELKYNRMFRWSSNHCVRYSVKPVRYSKLVQKIIWKIVSRESMDSKSSSSSYSIENLGEAIHNIAVSKIEDNFTKMDESIMLLKQAACTAHADAMYMLSVILANGIFVRTDDIQSHSYLLLASLKGHRLSSLALAHKYLYGLDAVPQQIAVAFMYFKYVADKTRFDREEHKNTDVLTESIRLTDEDLVKEQTDENGDIFNWLKHQAKQGVLSAQLHVGRALFWGAQGLKRNMESATKYFRDSAASEDPSAMYDYGIVLMRGQGTEKNEKKGLEQIKKAAEKKNPQALNALGWYAMEKQKNYTLAAEYFKNSHRLGSPDGSYHLGHMYFTGIFPGHGIDVNKAYEFFVWAAQLGQLEAGLMVAYQNMRGTDKLPINKNVAIEWARFIAERNPSLGYMLRKGLHAFRNKDLQLAIFYYLMAAEAGIEVGTFNVAWLCEENKNGITSFLGRECQWRNYNLSTLREFHFVDSHALIKMGDYHWYGCPGRRNLTKAMHFYMGAASKGNPHGIFSLAQMVEEGIQLEKSDLDTLQIPLEARKNNVSLIYELYYRCKESSKAEAYVPCSIALWRIQLIYIWKQYHLWMKVSSMFGLALIITSLVYNLVKSYQQINLISAV
ncbi:protein sel-1 homolog 3-like [Argonauta hians]